MIGIEKQCFRSCSSRRMYSRSPPGSAGAGAGTNRLTPHGPDVAARTARISSLTACARLYPAARKPSPPASHTAIASSGVDGPPAIGAWTIGSGNVVTSNVGPSLRSQPR